MKFYTKRPMRIRCKLNRRVDDKRLYTIWRDMRRRCTEPSVKVYPEYGGRGIGIYDLWYYSYSEFERWAHNNGYADNLSIERIDNDAGYCPDNCRWATMADQQLNKRRRKDNKTGFVGVSMAKNGTFKANIGYRGIKRHIGTFHSLHEAVNARNEFIKLNKIPLKVQEVTIDDVGQLRLV